MVADDALDASSGQVRMRQALEKLTLWLSRPSGKGVPLFTLSASIQQNGTTSPFLERTAKEHSGSTSISVALIVIGDAIDLHPVVRDQITRIAEQAIRNACLRSRASQLSIELRYASDLSLCFKDNGIGIDPEVADLGRTGHFGIQGMRERSACIHAMITIQSRLNAGTVTTLQVPGAIIYRRGDRSLRTRLGVEAQEVVLI